MLTRGWNLGVWTKNLFLALSVCLPSSIVAHGTIPIGQMRGGFLLDGVVSWILMVFELLGH